MLKKPLKLEMIRFTAYLAELMNQKMEPVTLRQLRIENVLVNGNGRIPEAPFRGYKQSGRDCENDVYGVEDYLEVKTLFL